MQKEGSHVIGTSHGGSFELPASFPCWEVINRFLLISFLRAKFASRCLSRSTSLAGRRSRTQSCTKFVRKLWYLSRKNHLRWLSILQAISCSLRSETYTLSSMFFNRDDSRMTGYNIDSNGCCSICSFWRYRSTYRSYKVSVKPKRGARRGAVGQVERAAHPSEHDVPTLLDT